MTTASPTAPVWFITGCSTGLGYALAKRVLQDGQRCVASARDAASLAELVAPHPQAALAVPLDVTREDQREAAVARAEATFGRIDVLVNNAGYGYLAPIEACEDDELRAMFETNFFGLAALLRRVLPGMRARRSGHVINITSIGGLIGSAASGYYCASKFAVEGLTEALAVEAAPHGIKVTAVEPGPFRTDWAGRSLRVVRQAPFDAYADTFGARLAQIRDNSGRQAGDPARAAEAILKLVASPNPPLHLLLGRNGLERVRAKLTNFQRSIDEWETVTAGADFPAA
jgi:NAD(P)-dependent dehydrogenase (short-subunit alcohol dehydrogenase family)